MKEIRHVKEKRKPKQTHQREKKVREEDFITELEDEYEDFPEPDDVVSLSSILH